MKQAILFAVLATALLTGPVAQAFEAGDWLVRVGASNVDPDDPNGSLLGADVDVDDDTSITFNGTYMWTKNIGIELLAATPFEHDIELGGAKVGSTKHLPPTLNAQWHFLPESRFQPYVGAGVNLTIFFDDEEDGVLKDIGGTLSLNDDTSVGLGAQVGMDVMINDRWFVNLDVRYIDIDTEAEVTLPDGNPLTGEFTKVDVDVDVDPFIYGLHVGYRFGK